MKAFCPLKIVRAAKKTLRLLSAVVVGVEVDIRSYQPWLDTKTIQKGSSHSIKKGRAHKLFAFAHESKPQRCDITLCLADAGTRDTDGYGRSGRC